MPQVIDVFMNSLGEKTVPTFSNELLTAVWHGLKGNWEDGHPFAQEEGDKDAAWVHAFLHRIEGASGNAAYWYRKAQRPVVKDEDFQSEGRAIAEYLLNKEK